MSALDNFLFFNCNYCEPQTIWPPSLVVSVSDYGTRELGSIPGWAPILQCVFLLFLAFNAELPQTSNMEYKIGKNDHS